MDKFRVQAGTMGAKTIALALLVAFVNVSAGSVANVYTELIFKRPAEEEEEEEKEEEEEEEEEAAAAGGEAGETGKAKHGGTAGMSQVSIFLQNMHLYFYGVVIGLIYIALSPPDRAAVLNDGFFHGYGMQVHFHAKNDIFFEAGFM